MRPVLTRFSSTAALAAVGGGLASALLSMLTVQKTSLALAMGCLSPLPIMLAALSFGSLPGFVAAVVGSLAVGLFDIQDNSLVLVKPDQIGSAGTDVLVYALSLALPAWWLARLMASTRLAAPTVAAADTRKLGLILMSAGAFSAASVTFDFISTINAHGGFQATMAMMTDRLQPYVESLFANNSELPRGLDTHKLAVVMTWVQMPVLTAASLVLLGFNIWLAGRITKASGRLAAPWPDIPRSLRAPRWLGLVLAAALASSLAGGLPGLIALIVAGTVTMAFAVHGMAFIHDVTRGKSFRFPLLIIVYLSLALLMPWLLAIYAVIGLCDAGLSFRERPRKEAEQEKS